VKPGDHHRPKDIRERTFAFSVRIVRLCRYLDEKAGPGRTLGWQLLRAGTSVGANVEEAQAAQSRADFINKNFVAPKEARETHYWLRLLVAAGLLSEYRIAALQSEVDELMRVLGAIILSAKKAHR